MTVFVPTAKRWRPSGCCPKCGALRRTLHKDHIVPVWKGGADDPSNWQYICANCHEDKSRLDLAGKRHSPEVLRRIRAARGTYGPISQQHRESIRRWATGRTHTPEAKAKIRESKLAYWAQRKQNGGADGSAIPAG